VPLSDHGPLYVIVHRRHDYRSPRDELLEVQPDDDLENASERAAQLQDDAHNRYGRTRDTYRVAELRFVNPADRQATETTSSLDDFANELAGTRLPRRLPVKPIRGIALPGDYPDGA